MSFRSGRFGSSCCEVAEQEVDVEAALVGLVDDDRVVAAQHAVALDLGQQDAVGHHLHQRLLADRVGEAHGVADGGAELGAQLLGDALGDGAGRDPARLGVADEPAVAAAELEAQLGQLGALARAGLAGDDDHLMVADRGQQVVAMRVDGEGGMLHDVCQHGTMSAVAHPTISRRLLHLAARCRGHGGSGRRSRRAVRTRIRGTARQVAGAGLRLHGVSQHQRRGRAWAHVEGPLRVAGGRSRTAPPSRSIATYLVRSITDPAADVPGAPRCRCR